MKIASVSDPHMGNFSLAAGEVVNGVNYRGRLALSCLASAVTLALDEGCELLVINGDLFDVSNPPPALVWEVSQILSRIPTAVNLGNHDCESFGYRDNACALLDILPSVTVAHKACRVDDFWLVPFQAGNPKDWLPAKLEEGKGCKYVSLHMGLSTDRTPSWLLSSQGAVQASHLASLCRKAGFTHAFLGDWHEQDDYSNKSVQLHQVGTLCPHDFNDSYKSAGQMCILDTTTGGVSYKYVPGPRFFKSTINTPLNSWVNHCLSTGATHIFAQIEAAHNGLAFAREETQRVLEASGLPFNFAVNPKKTAVSAEVKAAVAAVQGASNSYEAVVSWVSTRTLPSSVKTEQLVSKIVDYLG